MISIVLEYLPHKIGRTLHIMLTTPTITIVPGRKAGHSNVIINGYRYTNDRKRGNKTYMKCVLYIIQRLQNLHHLYGRAVDNSGFRPSNPRCTALRNIRTRFQAVPQEECRTDRSSNQALGGAAVSGMNFETCSKLNCQIRSMEKMARKSRRIVHSYPTSPRTLELIAIPCKKYSAASKNSSREIVSVAIQCTVVRHKYSAP